MSAGWIDSETEAVAASRVAAVGKTLADVFDKKRVFLGFSDEEIAEQIRLCREAGRTTASLGLRHGDSPAMTPANICFSCESRQYSSDAPNEANIEALALQTIDECDQSVRRNADVLIRRAGPDGGGLSGIANAIYTARAISFRMMLTMQYLLVAQFLRVALVAIPLLFGWLTISPALLLISGVWVDLAYIVVCALRHCSLDVLREAPDHTRFFKAPLRSRPDWVCATLICGAFTVLAGWILKGTGVAPQAGGLQLYTFLALLAAQTCLVLCLLRAAGAFSGSWKAHASALLILAILLGLLCPIVLIPPIATWFGANGITVLILLFALFAPLYLLGSYFISLSYRPRFMRMIREMFGKFGKNGTPRS